MESPDIPGDWVFTPGQTHPPGVNILELAACGILDDSGPGFIGFTERHRVGMAWPAVSAEGFVGLFRNVRSAHDHRHTNGANRVGHAVRFRDHPRHRADPYEADVFFAHKLCDACFIHRLRVAIDEHYFVAFWSQ
jgi:hypothetical protein